jgi:hypothetical protein
MAQTPAAQPSRDDERTIEERMDALERALASLETRFDIAATLGESRGPAAEEARIMALERELERVVMELERVRREIDAAAREATQARREAAAAQQAARAASRTR